MKSSFKISLILIYLITISSVTEVNAQAMLRGNPSLENFIGSPGMWVISIGIIVLIAFVLFVRKKTKMIPESIRKTS